MSEFPSVSLIGHGQKIENFENFENITNYHEFWLNPSIDVELFDTKRIQISFSLQRPYMPNLFSLGGGIHHDCIL